MHRNNFSGRRQKKLESRLGETVRIASIVQKGMDTGRSSYVEMRALDRLTNHNIKSRADALRQHAKPESDLAKLLSIIPSAVSAGYTDVLTPNGIVREQELDRLLSIDGDIVTCLGIIESEIKSRKQHDAVGALKELVEERKKLVDSLRA